MSKIRIVVCVVEGEADEVVASIAEAIEGILTSTAPPELTKPEAPPAVSIAGTHHSFRRYRTR